MVVLLGKNLNPWKRTWYALQAFEGVGLYTAKRLCDQSLVHPLAKVKDLSEAHLIKLKALLQPMLEAQRQKKLLFIKASKNFPKPILPL
jgi:ribosomal protein S13